jgi:glycosyltransferase involved in cell wall biosynthesis
MKHSERGTPDFSVILATRDRAESLRETLEALMRQETGGAFTYEILVVDNGSTDSTQGVIGEPQATSPVLLRYLYEGRQGKPFALNTGLQYAAGQFLAFTDDDILPTPMWLTALWRCFREEQADGVAGRILPRWIASRPAWLTDQMVLHFGALGCVDHGPHRLSSLAKHDCRWVGGNLAIRRAVVSQVGGYHTHMDRAEDTEYYYRCVYHGLSVVYEPTALVYHKIWPERMTPQYLRWWHHTTGYYHAYALPWRASHVFTVVPADQCLKSLGLALRWGLLFLIRRPWAERFYDELLLRLGFSAWLHRLQLWPPWCWAVLTGRQRKAIETGAFLQRDA